MSSPTKAYIKKYRFHMGYLKKLNANNKNKNKQKQTSLDSLELFDFLLGAFL